ncbi:MAG: N-acetylneuraminate synthase [Ignavibacteriota bacterium]|jgi:N-acetylneuraminate synthase|nr:N-acetylneuraminate synthase family protein [Ignavibacteriales bacterium]MBL1123507.1 N-acetylneuraminate synthase [Ignavibacteriota bacterium]MCC7094611.1 N-acetylneuraminate synthase family protein [Ignavibacteriaceae bacterium]MCE7857053.1 N-acetylneuraminate synthase [Ignavibacteria bacterium CHB3]MEB2297507.1 N-acetylneuraminate synthase family protein [Ignavibacteria bacterium]
MRSINTSKIKIGDGHPVFIVAEIGINHNGSLDIAKKLIEGAKSAGCDAVKFQKRTPEICVPKDQWNIERDTPWGRMTYIDYRHKVEFNKDHYSVIDKYCNENNIIWFASCWDESAVDFIEQFDVPIHKTASASLTDTNLLMKHKNINKPTIVSSGMSTIEEIEAAEKIFEKKNLLIAHSTSSYPCRNEELNLKMITTLRNKYPEIPIGYSGHETGLAPTWAAVSLGANFVERHITLDRAMWGSDQAASVEIEGFHRLVRNIRDIEIALGDGVKRVYPSEMNAREKLRRIK